MNDTQKAELAKLIRQAQCGIIFATDREVLVERVGEEVWAELAKRMEWN